MVDFAAGEERPLSGSGGESTQVQVEQPDDSVQEKKRDSSGAGEGDDDSENEPLVNSSLSSESLNLYHHHHHHHYYHGQCRVCGGGGLLNQARELPGSRIIIFSSPAARSRRLTIHCWAPLVGSAASPRVPLPPGAAAPIGGGVI